MEYIPNGDLGRYIKENRSKAKANARTITEQILRGLVVLHERDICHRDLKPQVMYHSIFGRGAENNHTNNNLQNILIASISPIHVKITDFGISKRAIDTSLRTNCGTTAYRAPELLGLLPRNLKLGRSYSNAVDLWALGVVVHEILTSEIPFLEPDSDTNRTIADEPTTRDDSPPMVDMELLFQYCRDPTLFPSQSLHTSGMGDTWQAFVRSLLVVDPRDRPSAPHALNNGCFTENDLEILRNQLGLLLTVELRSAAITVILESEPGVFVAILHAFGGATIQQLHREATEMGFLEVVWLVGRAAYEAYFGGDLSSIQLPPWYGRIDMVKFTRDGGDFVDPFERTFSAKVLQESAADGYLDVVKLLIAQGGDTNEMSRYRMNPTPLKAAAQNGNVDMMKLLIARGANLNATSGWHGSLTALQAAAENGHVDGMTVLLSHGANINAMCFGRTALHIAAETGKVDAIRVLLAHGADVNANYRGWTALHDAAEKGHVDSIKILLAHGADFDEEDKGWPALQTAVVHGQVGAIRVLLAHGAEVGEGSGGAALRGAAGGSQGSTNFGLRKPRRGYGGTRPCRRRVDRMRDVHEGRKRWTPLQLAATNNHREAITVLLAHGLGMVSQTGATGDLARG